MLINPAIILDGLKVLNTKSYDYKIPELILTERANNIAMAVTGSLEERVEELVEPELQKLLASPAVEELRAEISKEIRDQLSKTVIRVMNERERLIYWLIQTTANLAAIQDDPEVTSIFLDAAEQCLKDVGYESGGERAQRMIMLGEPGRP